MNIISNSYQLFTQIIVERVSDVPDLEVHLNHMHTFEWILSIDDKIIHMWCNLIISLIVVRFRNT